MIGNLTRFTITTQNAPSVIFVTNRVIKLLIVVIRLEIEKYHTFCSDFRETVPEILTIKSKPIVHGTITKG